MFRKRRFQSPAIFGTAGGGGGPFTPLSLPGLLAWYKADAGVFSDAAGTTPQTTNNGVVGCWKDQSGNNFHITQPNSGKQPLFQTAGLNGKQTILFNSADPDYLIYGPGFPIGTGNVASVVIIGQMLTGTAAYGRCVTYLDSTLSDTNSGCNIFILRDSSNNAVNGFNNGAAFYGTSSVSLATTTRIASILDGTNGNVYINNGTPNTSAVSASFVNNGYIALGAHSAVASPIEGWSGPISEVVITNQAMSSTDRNNMDSYLTGRW